MMQNKPRGTKRSPIFSRQAEAKKKFKKKKDGFESMKRPSVLLFENVPA